MNVSLRSVQLFRFDSEGRLKVGLLRHLHSVTSPYQVRKSVGWCGLQGFVGTFGRVQRRATVGFAEMTCCICLFATECLGLTATMLSRWDLESGGLFCVEYGFFVWRDGVDAIPAIRFDCPLSQGGGIAPLDGSK